MVMEMKTRVSGDINIIEISGRFDTNTVPPVATWLEQVTSAPKARVLVNLADTTFVDSTALATLVQALKRCQQMQGDLCVCSLRRPVYMIFELTRLDKAFNIFVDEEHAIQSFNN
jgi:anti-sigma B factor antagonist